MANFEDELESLIEKDKKISERGKALKRLLNSTDFKNVILSGFLREHALKLIYDRANSTEPDDATSRKIDAVAQFKAYLDSVLDEAEIADKAIAENGETLYQSRNEEQA